MRIAAGVVIVLLSLLAWGGQAISWLAPGTAARLSLRERDETVDPAFAADARGEALWDALTLWTMCVAGVLLIVDAPGWPHLGLIGGGMYLYFAGRGICTRALMQRRGLRIGSPTDVAAARLLLSVWGVMALAVIVAAIVELRG